MARSGDGSWNGNVMSASSVNRRRILSLWLPRLPIDRIKRKLAQDIASQADAREVAEPSSEASTSAGLSPPLRGRVGERGTTDAGVHGLPLSLTLPHKGGGNESLLRGIDVAHGGVESILMQNPRLVSASLAGNMTPRRDAVARDL